LEQLLKGVLSRNLIREEDLYNDLLQVQEALKDTPYSLLYFLEPKYFCRVINTTLQVVSTRSDSYHEKP
jgi:hypothetical protein